MKCRLAGDTMVNDKVRLHALLEPLSCSQTHVSIPNQTRIAKTRARKYKDCLVRDSYIERHVHSAAVILANTTKRPRENSIKITENESGALSSGGAQFV